MAGTDSRFDASAFRDAIHFAMTMGLPNTTSERATFHWLPEPTFHQPDASGNPFTWDSTPVTNPTFVDVLVPVAVEFKVKAAGDTLATRIGEFDTPHVVITILDTDYPSLTQNSRFADQVLLADATYNIEYVHPPIGLFDVTIYQLDAKAVDEA